MSGWKDMVKKLEQLDGLTVEVGWQANVDYPDGTKVAHVARWLNYGVEENNIPPYQFMENTISRTQRQLGQEMSAEVLKVVRGTRAPYAAIDYVGQLMVGEIRQTIASLGRASEAVIKARQRKGRNTTQQLVDTGLMISSLTSVVKEE